MQVFQSLVRLPQCTKKMMSDAPVDISSFHAVDPAGSVFSTTSNPALINCCVSGGAIGPKNVGPRTGTLGLRRPWPRSYHRSSPIRLRSCALQRGRSRPCHDRTYRIRPAKAVRTSEHRMPRRSIHLLPALPVHVHIQEKTSNLARLSDFLLPRLH